MNQFLEHLIDYLGVDGARAGLRASKKITIEDLRLMAEKSGKVVPLNAKRNEIISLILLDFDRRIDRSVEELKRMTSNEINDYLTKSGASQEEIIELLQKAGVPIKKVKSKKQLIDISANSISGIGLYQRISNRDDLNSSNREKGGSSQ